MLVCRATPHVASAAQRSLRHVIFQPGAPLLRHCVPGESTQPKVLQQRGGGGCLRHDRALMLCSPVSSKMSTEKGFVGRLVTSTSPFQTDERE